MIRFFKRIYKRGYVKFLRRIDAPEKLDEYQKKGIRIFKKALLIKDAEIFISPLSDSIYIEVDEIYIILENHELKIINGRFQHDLNYSHRTISQLKKLVLHLLERRRAEVEKRILAKSDRTLDSILKDVEEIKKVRNFE